MRLNAALNLILSEYPGAVRTGFRMFDMHLFLTLF